MANCKIVYPSGADPGDQVTYTFPKNPDFGHRAGERVNLNDDQRTFDGTLLRYAGPLKKRYELSFTHVTKAQADYFLTLWDFNCPIDLYLDGTNLDATVMMMESPAPDSQGAFSSDGVETYSFDVIFEEV
jgi:hypothetical protein